MHRGQKPDRNGNAVVGKQSADALFGTTGQLEAHTVPHALPTDEFVTQTPERRQEILRWVSEF